MKPSQLFSKSFIDDIEKSLLHGKLCNDEVEVEYVDADQFLNENRVDLLCKMYYIECREKGVGIEFAKELYIAHIIAITDGKCAENWNSEKNSIDVYFSVFDQLIDEIKMNGFDTNKSVIPVGEDGIILDGAHRTAIALYFGIKMPIVRLKTKSWRVSIQSLINRGKNGLDNKYSDFIFYLFIKYKKSCFFGVIWPISYRNPSYGTALRIINSVANVAYTKTVQLNYNGMTQLMMHSYFDQEWTGLLENRFDNILPSVNERYAYKDPCTVLLLYDSTLEEIKKLKSVIRIVLNDGFCKIHITDTKKEAIRLGQMLLNQNSIDFLNKGKIFYCSAFVELFLEFRKVVLEKKIEEEVCIDTGAVLAAYGLRESFDVDYIGTSSLADGFDKHTQEYYDQIVSGYNCEEIIYNWFNHFYCFDIKFEKISIVSEIKERRNEEKDIKDVLLIKKMQSSSIYDNENNGSRIKLEFIRFVKRVFNKLFAIYVKHVIT